MREFQPLNIPQWSDQRKCKAPDSDRRYLAEFSVTKGDQVIYFFRNIFSDKLSLSFVQSFSRV